MGTFFARAHGTRSVTRDYKHLGAFTGFSFLGSDWGLEPQSAFYDWLYINALLSRQDLAEQVTDYSAFTDIEFNPERSINC